MLYSLLKLGVQALVAVLTAVWISSRASMRASLRLAYVLFGVSALVTAFSGRWPWVQRVAIAVTCASAGSIGAIARGLGGTKGLTTGLGQSWRVAWNASQAPVEA